MKNIDKGITKEHIANTLHEFGKCSLALSSLLLENPELSETDQLFIDNHTSGSERGNVFSIGNESVRNFICRERKILADQVRKTGAVFEAIVTGNGAAWLKFGLEEHLAHLIEGSVVLRTGIPFYAPWESKTT